MPYLLRARTAPKMMRDPSNGVMYRITDEWVYFGDKQPALTEDDTDIEFREVAEQGDASRGVPVTSKPNPPMTADPTPADRPPTLIQRRAEKAEENIKRKRKGRPRKVPI